MRSGEFLRETKRHLALRAGYICSNPNCLRMTVGPSSVAGEFIIVGVAAHICGARPGSARYNPSMSPAERSSIENGIWLCRVCEKLVDSDERQYTSERLKQWKVEHDAWLSKGQENPELIIKKSFMEGVSERVTAKSLADAGFAANKLDIILKAQERAAKQQNVRYIEFLRSYVEHDLDGVPPVWRALIAGFPIIGGDIEGESFVRLAALVRELHPYLSKVVRREYHRRVKPILVGILAEGQAFIDDSVRAGGLWLGLGCNPPLTRKELVLSWLGLKDFTEKGFRVDEALARGCWAYSFPKEVFEGRIEIERTWAGFLYDIISRLPDPDRQKGQLIKNGNLPAMIDIWCSTAREDFRPPLTRIHRSVVLSSDHTLAGAYKLWKEGVDKWVD
jgi:hypothetical protein